MSTRASVLYLPLANGGVLHIYFETSDGTVWMEYRVRLCGPREWNAIEKDNVSEDYLKDYLKDYLSPRADIHDGHRRIELDDKGKWWCATCGSGPYAEGT